MKTRLRHLGAASYLYEQIEYESKLRLNSLAHDSSRWVLYASEAPRDVQYDLSIYQSVSTSKSREGRSE